MPKCQGFHQGAEKGIATEVDSPRSGSPGSRVAPVHIRTKVNLPRGVPATLPDLSGIRLRIASRGAGVSTRSRGESGARVSNGNGG
jgi:hypothetical protein